MTDKIFPVMHSDAEWRHILTADQYDVLRGHGTEAPDSCALLSEKRPGRFAWCRHPRGSTWPRFTASPYTCSVAIPTADHRASPNQRSSWCTRSYLAQMCPGRAPTS